MIKNSSGLTVARNTSRLLELNSVLLARSLRGGRFASRYRGTGEEFYSVRPYIAGDDVRLIDPNVTARSSYPYIREYEELRELPLLVILDASLSISYNPSILDTAIRGAKLLLLSGAKARSPVGLIVYAKDLVLAAPPKVGESYAFSLSASLDKVRDNIPKEGGSALVLALKKARGLLYSPSIVVLISDYRVTDYEEELLRLSYMHDLVALRLTYSDAISREEPAIERALSMLGTLRVRDIESGSRALVALGSLSYRRARAKEHSIRFHAWHSLCTEHKISNLTVGYGDDIALKLIGFFNSRG